MNKRLIGLVTAGALALGAVGVTAQLPASATTRDCTYTIGWYKQDASRIVGPDLTVELANAILAKTGKSSLVAVLWASPQGSADLIAAKQLIAAAANGYPGGQGFQGTVGNAFYALAEYFEGKQSLTPAEVTAAAAVLDSYNNGLLGVPHC